MISVINVERFRAVAKTAILEHGAEVIGIEDGFEGLVEDRVRPLDYLSVSDILTRGGSPSPFDRILASRLGREACKLGRTGFMAGLRGTEIVPVPLEQVAGKQHLVEPNHHLLQTARSVGTCFGYSI